MEWGFVVAGLLVGFIVGMTGVGGGSLMTPILLWFGIPASTAVGTDLLYAALTKAGGVIVHHRQKHVDWKLVMTLAAGSVPASLLTLLFLSTLPAGGEHQDALLRFMLGVALFLTALAILGKSWLLKHVPERFRSPDFAPSPRLVALVGAVLGVLVTLSSIGAGALGTLALFLLFPLLPTARLIGSEIAHAVPLTLVAGLGHAGLGNVEWSLLLTLLCGSLPGIWLGSHLAGRVHERFLRPALAIMLAIIGAKLMVV